MENFIFKNDTKIIFGKGFEKQVGTEMKLYGKKVLLHYGGGSIKKSGLYDTIISELKKEDMQIFELSGVVANPRLTKVREGIQICKNEGIDAILAVGGGSVIDSAKAIAIGSVHDCDVWDFYTGKTTPNHALDIGVVLTIPAAGSESSPGSVITNEEGLYKRACISDIIRPKFAIINPELTFTLPAYQTAAGSVDIMAHVMERYFTNVSHVELTDRLCESVLQTMINNAPKAINNPNNYNARSEIMWSGTIAHNDLLSTGRVGDWASHNIEHELSGIYDIAHGAGLAIVFPAWMRYVHKQNINRFVQFANRVFGVSVDYYDLEAVALEGIRRLEAFFKQIGMPTRLSDVDIDDSRLREMAEKAVEMGTQGQFVKLNSNDIYTILKSAL